MNIQPQQYSTLMGQTEEMYTFASDIYLVQTLYANQRSAQMISLIVLCTLPFRKFTKCVASNVVGNTSCAYSGWRVKLCAPVRLHEECKGVANGAVIVQNFRSCNIMRCTLESATAHNLCGFAKLKKSRCHRVRHFAIAPISLANVQACIGIRRRYLFPCGSRREARFA